MSSYTLQAALHILHNIKITFSSMAIINAAANHHFMPAVIMLIILSLDFTVAQIGVAYGRNGNNLLPPSRVVQLYQRFNIKRMRIYETDPEILRALRCSNIDLTVGIPNPDLQRLAEDPSCANAWVRYNIMNYQDVKFRHIVVGNEVRPGNPKTEQYAPFVLRAMINIYNSVSRLRRGIKVTTAFDTEILAPNSSFPPENGRFRPELAPYLDPIVRFLVVTGAPLYANIYPYFAFVNNEANIDLGYALSDPNYPGVVTQSGTTYKNLFYALLDAVNAALEKCATSMLFAHANEDIETIGGEHGWATKRKPGPRSVLGDDDVANVENARAYVNNMIQAVKTGTPRRPGKPIETYIFAMFDENLKRGNVEEKHFGLFTPDGVPKYPVNFD